MLRSGATSFYNADGLGTITSLANTSGSLAQTYSFDSFGNQTASSGSLTNWFQYTGREFDTETSLYYYRARYYDPNTGRFVQEDPINFGGGYNFYVYVRNSPTILIDPTGLQDQGGWSTQPPNAKVKTHVCDINGNQIVQIAKGQDNSCGLVDCVRVHEERHIRDSMAAVPDICKGQLPGTLVGSSGLTHKKTEIAASAAEIICLQGKLKDACDKCKKSINDRIAQMRRFRDSFKN